MMDVSLSSFPEMIVGDVASGFVPDAVVIAASLAADVIDASSWRACLIE